MDKWDTAPFIYISASNFYLNEAVLRKNNWALEINLYLAPYSACFLSDNTWREDFQLSGLSKEILMI